MNDTDPAETLCNEAKSLLHSGDTGSAIDRLRKLLTIRPDEVEAHHLLGRLLAQNGNLDAALLHFDRANTLAPGNPDLLTGIGSILLLGNRSDEAAGYIRRALEIDPEHAYGHATMGMILLSRGEPVKSVPHFEKALVAMPERTDLLINFANACEQLQQPDRSRELLAQALAIDPGNAAALLLRARLQFRDKAYDDAAATLRRLLAMDPQPSTAVSTWKLLGAVLDRTGQYDAAFAAYLQAAALAQTLAEETPFDESYYLTLIEQSKTASARQHPAPAVAVPDDGIFKSPVFFVGFPRSGTTLVEQILSTRNGLVTSNEEPLVDRLIREHEDLIDEEIPLFSNHADLTEEKAALLRSRYFELFQQEVQPLQEGAQVVDKLPLNIIQLGFINRVFPDSPVIVAVRDPRDCCLSAFMQDFRLNPAMLHMITLESSARFYDRVMDLWIHYRDTLDLNYFQYRYEDLVGDFERVTRELLQFIGEEWDDQVSEFYRTAQTRRISTPSYQDVTRPLYSRSLQRWKNYEKYLQPVMPYLEKYIQHFGYAEH